MRAVLRRHRLWATMQPDVRMMPVHEVAGKALTEDEARRLLDACQKPRSRVLLPVVTVALHTGMRRGEIQSLRWRQIDFLDRTLTVGATKTQAGSGRVIPLNERAFMTLQSWATNFLDRQSPHYVFPREHYGLAGNERRPHSRTVDPTQPIREIKECLESRQEAGRCRSTVSRPQTHRLHPPARTGRVAFRGRLDHGLERKHDRHMAKRYGHIGNEAKRDALDTLIATRPSGTRQTASGANTSTASRRD